MTAQPQTRLYAPAQRSQILAQAASEAELSLADVRSGRNWFILHDRRRAEMNSLDGSHLELPHVEMKDEISDARLIVRSA